MIYTKGPWKMGAMTNGPNRVYSNGRTICKVEGISCGGRWPNGDFEGPKLHAIGKANQRLIAAAPELLEACEIALEYLTAFGIEKNEYVWNPLKKAIAKARGKK